MERQGLGTLQLREIGRQEGRTPTDAYVVRHCPVSRVSFYLCFGLPLVRLVVAGLRAGAQFGGVRPLQANGAVDDSLPQRPATKRGCFEVERTA